jgi:hypothetical protein
MLVVQDILLIKMIIKKRIQDNKLFLSIYDDDLKNKIFEENEKQIDLRSSFYEGENINIKDIEKLLNKSYFISCIGKDSVNFLTKKGLINEKNIKQIKKIPYSFILIN